MDVTKGEMPSILKCFEVMFRRVSGGEGYW